jgi:hypothetical protein
MVDAAKKRNQSISVRIIAALGTILAIVGAVLMIPEIGTLGLVEKPRDKLAPDPVALACAPQHLVCEGRGGT